mmetsp:Transcript_27941/g.75291  ORF Transcript_27941/g.75291 Transcript_27941/m.75291 type:complete len:214 (-) Transcript_27941:284-925(-)
MWSCAIPRMSTGAGSRPSRRTPRRRMSSPAQTPSQTFMSSSSGGPAAPPRSQRAQAQQGVGTSSLTLTCRIRTSSASVRPRGAHPGPTKPMRRPVKPSRALRMARVRPSAPGMFLLQRRARERSMRASPPQPTLAPLRAQLAKRVRPPRRHHSPVMQQRGGRMGRQTAATRDRGRGNAVDCSSQGPEYDESCGVVGRARVPRGTVSLPLPTPL